MVGVLGGGQLGQMLARAGKDLGLKVICFDPNAQACAQSEAPLTVGAFDDIDAVLAFASACDVVTLEFENIPVRTLGALRSAGHAVHPGPTSLRVAQDRIAEKQLFDEIGIPTQAHAAVDSLDQLASAIERVGLPAVLKTRRDGYDGKGQFVLREPGQLTKAWQAVGGKPCILEAFVPFRREISVVVARDSKGEVRAFAATENVHVGGILHRSVAAASAAKAASDYAKKLAEHLGHVGVLTLELFETDDGELIGNEFAPRVHNSGHWTLNAGSTDQFSQHLRAVVGLPMVEPELAGGAAMINLVGELPPADALDGSCASVHLYGKSPRAGRKLGHLTWSAASASGAQQMADAWAERWLSAERLPERSIRQR